MRPAVDIATAQLERTPGMLRAMLAGIDPPTANAVYAENTFSAIDVLGHLIEGETHDWIPRIRHVLAHGTSVPFEPFDRYAHFRTHAGKDADELLGDFASQRATSLDELVALALSPDDLSRQGTHPDLGTVTINQLIATWAAHDLNHIAQIARCLAAPLRNETGRWRDYLGIYQLPARSMDAEGVAAKARHNPQPDRTADQAAD